MPGTTCEQRQQGGGHPLPALKRSSVRGVGRLVAFGCLTARRVAACIRASRFAPFSPLRSAYTVHTWSQELVQALGVEVTCSGSPPSGGVMVVANHRSYIDIALIGACVPCTFLAKAEIERWPLIGYGARQYGGVVFVQREEAASRRSARTRIAERVAERVAVVVFPEGTTSAGPGVLPFRPGAFEVAAATGCSVVPAAVRYEDPGDAWVGEDTFVGHFLRTFGKRRVRAHVAFGPVLDGSTGPALRARAEMWIRGALREGEGPEEEGETSTRTGGRHAEEEERIRAAISRSAGSGSLGP